MTFLEGAILTAAALAILSGEPPCETVLRTDGSELEVCVLPIGPGEADPSRFAPAAPAAIPEPATWALLVGGFALAGAALRRGRAAA